MSAPAANLPPPDPTLDQRVEAELVRTAYVDSIYGAIFASVVALLLAWQMTDHFPQSVIAPWLAFTLCGNALRFGMRWAYIRQPIAPAATTSWSRGFALVSGLVGVGWGWGGWVFADGETNHRIFVVLVLAGLVTGASRLLVPILAANLAYLYLTVIPLMARLILDPEQTHPILITLTVLFLCYMTLAARQQLQTLRRTIRLSLENTSLVASLGAEIDRRTLVEAELRSASTRAEAASIAKSEFLATMSHEIRTPMNGILGMLQIVRESELTPEQRAQIETAATSADALLDVLNDVLDFSKIEAGRLDLELIPFAPESTLSTVVDLLRPRAKAKGLILTADFASDLPTALVGDPTRLRQVLFNLLGNAVKFTAQGSVTLRIFRSGLSDHVSPTLVFSVVDTGIGMDAASVARLFSPFTQADSSMSRRFGGTGLGLAISHKLVEAMGGKISVRSEPGRGSEFSFSLRFDRPSAVDTRFLRAAAAPYRAPSLRGRILVVEDDRINQRVIAHFLTQMGLEHALVENGHDAVTTALQSPWDIILMDCQLPDLDGLEATRRIRTQLATRPLPIIALTANASTQDRAACFSAGMDDFLSKPVRVEHLAATLEKWLPRSRPAA